MVRRLIVNADDFGQTRGINRAILELHQAGVLTSASLMPNANATDEAIRIACGMQSLGVGCHIVLTEGASILHPSQIPSLLNTSGHFIPSLRVFLRRLFVGKIPAAEIESEATAQIRHLQSRGVHVDHIDTHRHIHMFPNVLRPILRAARACGVHSVRRPFEPEWAVRAIAKSSFVRSAQVNLLRRLESAWRVVLAEEGFATTDGTLGIAATGALNSANLRGLLQSLPAGTWELVTHPGYIDPDLARLPTKLQASREVERQALHRVRECGNFDLTSFGALTQAEE